ncbi:hypothetical protein [Brevundimonas abyssalis]|uniref:Cobalt-zinc-cadmium resistance protein czcI n=1 Tax=Brevundimonas abyssalis TAR-001 TaxID=1391729 RepID=A0A8E0KKG4_9CAUL|nr:hypothetical protein [Brevundimonas abyssalis]GAD58254.1 hypothetical protein MBEBAB_0504 [Brevundimonas abyssalis TAR-001]
MSLYAVIALLVAVFVAPTVDAAACAPEASFAAAHMVDDHSSDGASEDDAGERGGDHGLCSHGHCHHGGAARVDTASEAVRMTLSEERPPFVDDSAPSGAIEGLKRPPRA